MATQDRDPFTMAIGVPGPRSEPCGIGRLEVNCLWRKAILKNAQEQNEGSVKSSQRLVATRYFRSCSRVPVRHLLRCPEKHFSASLSAVWSFHISAKRNMVRCTKSGYLERLADRPSSNPEPDLRLLPREDLEFAQAFGQTDAKKLGSRVHMIKHSRGKGTTGCGKQMSNPAPEELEVLCEHVENSHRKTFVRHSQSPYSVPILFSKWSDGSLGLGVDYRGLNNVTIKNRCPLPHFNEIFHRVDARGTISSGLMFRMASTD